MATQTYGLGKELTENFEQTLQEIKKIGFNAIEPLLNLREYQEDAQKNKWSMETLCEGKTILDQLGLKISSVHVGIETGPFVRPADIAKKFLRIHDMTGADTFVASGMFESEASARTLGETFRKLSPYLASEGCRILFHNHNDEFHRVVYKGQNKMALDVFLDYAGPQTQLQLDIGWAGFEENELMIVEKYKERIYSLHLKDFYLGYAKRGYTRQSIPAEAFAPIGDGCIRTERILSMLPSFPDFCGTLVIDQDKYSGNMMEALKRGIANIKSWGITDGSSYSHA